MTMFLIKKKDVGNIEDMTKMKAATLLANNNYKTKLE